MLPHISEMTLNSYTFPNDGFIKQLKHFEVNLLIRELGSLSAEHHPTNYKKEQENSRVHTVHVGKINV